MDLKAFALENFEEIVPVLLRCFPDFWQERLGRGERSFPYDLELFAAEIKGDIIGTAGIHEYDFFCCDGDGKYFPVRTGGVCDIGVVPEMRGKGYAAMMQHFIIERLCRDSSKLPLIPLYTDKPPVYKRKNWQEYLPDNSREIRTEDFVLPEKTPHPQLEQLQEIYSAGKLFPGKVMRSEKSWRELLSDPAKTWHVENQSYFLCDRGRIIEAYSVDPAHAVNDFTPVNGGHDENKVMLNILETEAAAGQKTWQALKANIASGALQFPIADVF